jgi:hypothetical protein
MRALSRTMLSIWLLATAVSAFASSERTEHAPIVIAIVPWQDTIKAGNKLIISVTVENTSNKTIDISGNYFLNWVSPYAFKVWRDGVEQQETPTAEQLRRPGLSSSQLHEILPGKHDNATYELNDYFDFSQPGTYQIQFFGRDGMVLSENKDPGYGRDEQEEDEHNKRRFESNVITIVVNP